MLSAEGARASQRKGFIHGYDILNKSEESGVLEELQLHLMLSVTRRSIRDAGQMRSLELAARTRSEAPPGSLGASGHADSGGRPEDESWSSTKPAQCRHTQE